MWSQNAKKSDKGNFDWEQGSMLFKVLKSFSVGKNHLLYLFKKSPPSSPPQPHLSLFPIFIFEKRNAAEGALRFGPLSGAVGKDPGALVLRPRCSVAEQVCHTLPFLLYVSPYSLPRVSIYDMHNRVYERLNPF